MSSMNSTGNWNLRALGAGLRHREKYEFNSYGLVFVSHLFLQGFYNLDDNIYSAAPYV